MCTTDYGSCTFRIDSYFVIKVADFGLTESVAANEKYVRMSPDNKVKVPVKWMAIESLSDGIFSEKTDVVRRRSLSFYDFCKFCVSVGIRSDLLGDI